MTDKPSDAVLAKIVAGLANTWPKLIDIFGFESPIDLGIGHIVESPEARRVALKEAVETMISFNRSELPIGSEGIIIGWSWSQVTINNVDIITVRYTIEGPDKYAKQIAEAAGVLRRAFE